MGESEEGEKKRERSVIRSIHKVIAEYLGTTFSSGRGLANRVRSNDKELNPGPETLTS